MSYRLVSDINPAGSSSPRELTPIDGTIYFVAGIEEEITGTTTNDESDSATPLSQEINQVGLFRTNGNEGDTLLLTSSQSISSLTVLDDYIYFIKQGSDGFELWRSDGSQIGTKPVEDLYPNADPSFPQTLNSVGGALFFSANDKPDEKYPFDNGYEVWRKDSVEGIGTRFFRNLNPDLFFEVEYKEDEGKIIANISDVVYENDSFPREFTDVNGNIFFTAYTANDFYAPGDPNRPLGNISIGGRELFFSDGTESGTKPLNINKNIYSVKAEVKGEYEVTSVGALPNIPDFGFGYISDSSFPRNLTPAPSLNQIYFTAHDGKTGYELWSATDNGIIGDDPIYDLRPGLLGSFPEELTMVGKNLYFTAVTKEDRHLYIFNPEISKKPQKVKSSGSNPSNLTAINQRLFFSSESKKGREPYAADGTTAQRIKDLNKGIKSSTPENFELITRDGRNSKREEILYFTADDGKRGVELWELNLSKPNSNPRRTADIFPGPTSSSPNFLTNSEERLFFSAKNPSFGIELWTLGPSIKGPKGGSDSSTSSINIKEGEKFVYRFTVTNDSGNGTTYSWRKNGGRDEKLFKINQQGELRFKQAPDYEAPSDDNRDNIYEVVVRSKELETGLSSDQYIYISVTDETEEIADDGIVEDDPGLNEEVNKPPTDDQNENDGSGNNNHQTGNTHLIKNIAPKRKSSNPSHLYAHREQLFFSADNGQTGDELWSTKGKGASTRLFQDIYPGSNSSSPSSFAGYKNSLFFSANDGRRGHELWTTKGEKGKSERLADINSGKGSSSPADLLVMDSVLYMSANDGSHGRELWKHSLKSGETKLVKNIKSGSSIGSSPSELTPFSNQIIFAAEGDIYGRELWISDGSKDGTSLLLDINPGGLSSNPKHLSLLSKDLYFIGDTYFNGQQILHLDPKSLQLNELGLITSQAEASEPVELHASRDQLFFSAETIIKTPESSSGTDETSDSEADPGGFMVASDDIESPGVDHINTYNQAIDDYRSAESSELKNTYLDLAKRTAQLFLSDLEDSSLADDWNQYFRPQTNLSPIQIPEGITSSAAMRDTLASPGDTPNNPSESDNKNDLGRELWISNGQVKGNTLLKDIYPGKGSSNPKGFTTIGTNTYFSADDGIAGEELWISDGTEAGTYRLTDINEGNKNSSPRWITEFNDAIYFSAISDREGRELWRLDHQRARSNTSNRKAFELTRLVDSQAGRGRLIGKHETTDEFIFSRKNPFGVNQADQIIQFSIADGDRLQLDSSIFTGAKKKRFRTADTLQAFNQEQKRASNIIYFEPTGELYFDQNGRQPGLGDPKESGLFAVLKGAPELSAASIDLS